MPWRREPAHFLRYWTGPVGREATGAYGKQFKSVLVYYVNCHQGGRLQLAALPGWDWYDISARLACTGCGRVGWVDARLDWSEVINFNKGIR
ncbi:hypothetical protein [Bradyrhizobium genosp. P]|uniref:hypothetical protein n=1 Tax=Bradyrhizobium genosp. P TaxID=83641 RepID=UPI003CE81FB4